MVKINKDTADKEGKDIERILVEKIDKHSADNRRACMDGNINKRTPEIFILHMPENV